MPKHYHVRSNMPGYLPDGDPACYGNAEDAVAGLGSELAFWTEDEDNRSWEVVEATQLARALENRSSTRHRQEVAHVERHDGTEYLFSGHRSDRAFFIAVVHQWEPCPQQDG